MANQYHLEGEIVHCIYIEYRINDAGGVKSGLGGGGGGG